MANFQYKCVPVPTMVLIGKKDEHEKVIQTYEKIINENAQAGWEYVGIDTISSFKKAGCLGGLFGKEGEQIQFKLLIFKRSE